MKPLRVCLAVGVLVSLPAASAVADQPRASAKTTMPAKAGPQVKLPAVQQLRTQGKIDPANHTQAREAKQAGEIAKQLPPQGLPQKTELQRPGGVDLTGTRRNSRFPNAGQQQQGNTNPYQRGDLRDPLDRTGAREKPGSVDRAQRRLTPDIPRGDFASSDSPRPVGVEERNTDQAAERVTIYDDGSKVRETNNGAEVWTERYNAAGELVSVSRERTNAEGVTTTTTMDNRGFGRVDIHDPQDQDIPTDDINRMPREDATAGGCNPVTGKCTGAPATDPNRVNPGTDGGAPEPTAPQLRVDQRDLVSDPQRRYAVGTGKVVPLQRKGTYVNPETPPTPNAPSGTP